MSIVLLAALGPPLPAAQFTVCVPLGAVRLHVGPTARTCSPQSPLPAGPSRGTCSGLLSPDIPPCQRLSRSSSPTSFFPASLPPRPGSLRCRETSSSFPRDTTRTRCFPDSDVLCLSVHRHDHQTLGSKTTAAMPCARHEDSVPLVAVAEEACRGNPLFRCFEFFGATLPFESNRAIAKALHAALAAAGPCSPRLTLDGRMGMIPAGLNFQHPRPSTNRVGDRPGTRTMMALGMAAITHTTHTHRPPASRPSIPRATPTRVAGGGHLECSLSRPSPWPAPWCLGELKSSKHSRLQQSAGRRMEV